jgi:hypothetical protein
MREEQEPTQQPAEHEDYVAPALTDLGAFEEITKLGSGGQPDAEGSSGTQ